MNNLLIPRFFQLVPKLALACSLSLSNLWVNSFSAIAFTIAPENPLNVNQSQLTTELALSFELPPRGAPGSRTSAASRDYSQQIMALVPKTNFGFTTKENLSLWVYFPYTEPQQIKLTFKDLEQQIYQDTFTLSGTPGIVEISLPETVKLEFDKVYFWELEVGFKPYGDEDNPVVRGGIERVILDNALKSQLEEKSEREKIEIYAQESLWFDVLSGLISLHQSNPEDEEIEDLWVSLLEQIGFEDLKDQSVVELIELP